MNALLKGQPSGRFLGVNLRQDRVSLADEQVAKAINCDMHSQPGVIVLRLGRTAQNTGALADTAIRRLARINSHRYRVAGQSLYCDDTKVLNGILSATLITTMMPFRPLNDGTIWNFIADDAVMRKVNCATVGIWGIAAAFPPSYIAAGEGTLSGVYSAAYTYARLFLSAVAAEGSPTALSTATITLSSEYLAIYQMDEPTDSTITSIGVYRSVAGSTVPQLDRYLTLDSETYAITHGWEVAHVSAGLTALQLEWSVNLGTQDVSVSGANTRGSQDWEEDIGSGNSEDAAGRHATQRWEITDGYVTTQTYHWAFASSKADADLGAIIEEDNGIPPDCSWVTNFQEHAFLCRDADNPHYLWFSKRFKPEAVPATNFLEIGNADDPLQCALPIGGQLGVFARRMKYRVMGNATTGFVALEAASPRGTPCPMAALSTEDGILFAARDGFFSTMLASPDVGFGHDILPLFFGETVNDMLPFNWDQANTFSAATYKGRYYFSYAEIGNSTPNRLAVYSRDTKHWYFYDHPLRSLYVEEDTDLLLGGGLDGFVYLLEHGTTDGGDDIALDVDTKDFEGLEGKHIRKLFQFLKVHTNTGGATVTVKLYVDDTLVHTATVSTSARSETLLKLPQAVMGHLWRVNFTYTGSTRIRIYECAALYLPLAVA